MKIIKRILLVVSILAVLAGAVYALDWLGVINAQDQLAKLLGNEKTQVTTNAKQVATKANSVSKSTAKAEVNPLQQENTQLKTQVKDLQLKLNTLKKEKEALAVQQVALEQEALNQTANEVTVEDSKETSYKQLAKYYAEMKPKDAVAILDKLEDDTVIGILINLENDQTAKILTAMDPKRAALLVNKLTL